MKPLDKERAYDRRCCMRGMADGVVQIKIDMTKRAEGGVDRTTIVTARAGRWSIPVF